MKKIQKMNEIAWVIGIVLCTLGICLCTKANLGLSMIAAPPYIFHVWLRDLIPWFTQGTAEYFWQGVILIITCIATRKFKMSYLLSFGTAVIAGVSLDMWFWIFGGNGAYEEIGLRIFSFVVGLILSSIAVAFVFRTTLPAQIYELAVMAIADKFALDRGKVKMANDVIMFVLSAVLSFVLTGGFGGFGIGTIVITIINAPLITLFGKIIDRYFEFDSMFSGFFKER